MARNNRTTRYKGLTITQSRKKTAGWEARWYRAPQAPQGIGRSQEEKA